LLEFDARIWDSVFGYIELTAKEKSILNTDPVQRLRRLNPTPGASYVYPELTGSRFSHSLGVMHLAGRIIEQINNKRACKWNDEIVQKVRLAGLLHDIGHGPFSHTFDEFLRKKSKEYGQKPPNHEQIGCHILKLHKELKSELPDDWINEIAYIAWGKDVLKKAGINGKIINEYSKRDEMNLFSDIVHGPPYCADILDFLIRDSRHAGVVYGQVDLERLIVHMDDFNGKLGIEDKAFDAFESMILARYYMFKTVYFHKSSRGMECLLLDALEVIDKILKKEDGEGFFDIVQGIIKGEEDKVYRYMDFDDYFVYTMIRKYRKNAPKLKELADRIFHRRIPRRIYARRETEFTGKGLNASIDKDKFERFWIKKITEKAKQAGIKISEKDIFVDIPSFTAIPIHAEADKTKDSRRYLFTRKNKKRPFKLEKTIIEKLSPKEYQIQIYVMEITDNEREKLEDICEEIWKEAKKCKNEWITTKPHESPTHA